MEEEQPTVETEEPAPMDTENSGLQSDQPSVMEDSTIGNEEMPQEEEQVAPEEEPAPEGESVAAQGDEEEAGVMNEPGTETEDMVPLQDEDAVPDSDVIEDEEQILMEEDKLLYEEEREKNLTAAAVEDIVPDEMEPPEVKEFVEVEEFTEEPSIEEADPVSMIPRDTSEEFLESKQEDIPADISEKAEMMEDDQDVGAAKLFLQEPQAENELKIIEPIVLSAPEKPTKTKKGVVTSGIVKGVKTFQHSARYVDERDIQNAIRKKVPKHDYFGLIFSAQSKRPPSYYHNYFLPFQKQPRIQQHMKILGKVIPDHIMKPFTTSPTYTLPLSTVKIRWHHNRWNTVYKAEDLFAFLSRYGPIQQVYQLTPNSALVQFTFVESASKVMKMPGLGYPWDLLIVDWLDPRMNNRGFFNRYAHAETPAFKTQIGF